MKSTGAVGQTFFTKGNYINEDSGTDVNLGLDAVNE